MYIIYWLINQSKNRTYIGFTNNIKGRIKYHISKKVKSTKYFGKFRCIILEKVDTSIKARKREKYWKSGAGRKRLKELWKKIIK